MFFTLVLTIKLFWKDEEKPGIIIDYAEDKSIVVIEVLVASKKMPEPNAIEYMMA